MYTAQHIGFCELEIYMMPKFDPKYSSLIPYIGRALGGLQALQGHPDDFSRHHDCGNHLYKAAMRLVCPDLWLTLWYSIFDICVGLFHSFHSLLHCWSKVASVCEPRTDRWHRGVHADFRPSRHMDAKLALLGSTPTLWRLAGTFSAGSGAVQNLHPIGLFWQRFLEWDIVFFLHDWIQQGDFVGADSHWLALVSL